MGRIEDYREALRSLPRSDWAGYLTEHSGLPGPRGNLELAQAAADEGDVDWFDELIASDDEYRTVCGVVGLGRLLGERPDPALVERLRRHAADERWRVREAVAMALQRLGDADLPRLLDLVAVWADDPDPLVRRAAVAGICEPRLLRTDAARRRALATCAHLTSTISALPNALRRTAEVRVLRQALGYCWSVAIAADPAAGLPLFTALEDSDDADVRWVVRENNKKARLARLRTAAQFG
jgi:HEAT repeat protein